MKRAEQPKISQRRRKQAAIRDQKVSVEHATPGGSLGVPDKRELHDDPELTAEKGDRVEQPDRE